MKKIITLVGLLFTSIAFSQSYVGFLNDNYRGVHAVINNPANIVDSRFITDVNLLGLSSFVGNDYAGVRISDFGYEVEWDNTSKNPLSKNNGNLNLDILGPSFMLNITPKHSIAISTRARTILNVNDVNGKELNKIENYFDNGFDAEGNYSAKLGSLNSSVSGWAEVGLTYATVLMDEKEHFFKGGLTLKYLKGFIYAKANTANLRLDYTGGKPKDNTDSALTTGGEFTYEHSLEDADDLGNAFESLDFNDGEGFATDLGFTYEWRPDVDEYTYLRKDKTRMYYDDVNKYKLRLGLSITDIGNITYDNVRQETYNLNGDYINKKKQDAVPNGSTSDMLKHYFGAPIVSTNSAKVGMPTAFHFNADWNFNGRFYLNLDTNFDMSKKTGMSIENTYSLTPRYETTWFSAYLPIGIREYSGFNAGLGLRAGPFYIGSGSVLSDLISKKSKSVDFYIGFKVPIYHSSPKDRDGDGFFDKVDDCPRRFGPKENNGCPWEDRDRDYVKDNEDKCPDTPGEPENHGCPWSDRDHDGVTDNLDKCPDVVGLKDFNGCPDTDGDNIQDKFDKCPDKPGIPPDGCPKVEEKPEVIIITDNNVNNVNVDQTIGRYARSIYFNTASHTFRSGVTQKLDMIVNIMNRYPNTYFTINGYTDNQGNAESNLRLSERRARAVLDYLVSRGIAVERLESYGFGEDNPIATNATRAGRAKNRRVEIKAVR